MESEPKWLLTQQQLEKLKDGPAIFKELMAGKTGAEILGFSESLMERLYHAGYQLLQKNQVSESVDAFIFLATLGPLHSEYWMDLGVALQMSHDYEGAIDAFEIAAIYNVEHPLPYLCLARCLFAIHDRKSALQSLELAIAYADEKEEYADIREQANQAKSTLLKVDG
jgi:type III secretion system low calcium response chaperone LcrH/SycD